MPVNKLTRTFCARPVRALLSTDARGAPVKPLASSGQGAREKHTIACGFVAHRIITGGPRRNPVMSDPSRGEGHAIGMLAGTSVLQFRKIYAALRCSARTCY